MKKKSRSSQKFYLNNYIYLLIYSIIFVLISHVSINVSSIIYDYPFHLARIVGLAQSLVNHDFLPNLNYMFLNGSGYAVAMFYGNWMLYLPALVFIHTETATLSFDVFVWQSIFFTVCATNYVLEKITKDKLRALLGAIAISCSVTYFGFGMTAVVPLIPLLLYSIYKVIFEDRYSPVLLAVTIALLIQTHIISTLVLAIFSLILVLLNFNRLTLKKVKSFIISIILAIFLSSGFIFQYLEQSTSQTFFVSWKLRNYPFPSNALMSPGDLYSIVTNYYWPIVFLFIFLSIVIFKKLDVFSRQLILATLVMFIFSSNLLPWHILRETFLSVFQYTERLIYLLPVFVIFAIAKTAPKQLVILTTVLQLSAYVYMFPMTFRSYDVPYSDRGYSDSAKKIMKNTNEDALESYRNSVDYTYDTSGDEYLTIDVDHDNIRNGTIKQFEFDSNKVSISNVTYGYNRLEFDISLHTNAEDQIIVLPRIWYKGYTAFYSKGASGSQPSLLYKSKTDEELDESNKVKKPNLSQKVLYDGRASLEVSSSGHIMILYKKTIIQKIGYLIEFLSFVIIFIYTLFKNYKKSSYNNKHGRK